jgi:hypothetical protein
VFTSSFIQCEHGNSTLDFVECEEFLGQLRYYMRFKILLFRLQGPIKLPQYPKNNVISRALSIMG